MGRALRPAREAGKGHDANEGPLHHPGRDEGPLAHLSVMKGPFLTLGVMKGPFLTVSVTKGPFLTRGRARSARPAKRANPAQTQAKPPQRAKAHHTYGLPNLTKPDSVPLSETCPSGEDIKTEHRTTPDRESPTPDPAQRHESSTAAPSERYCCYQETERC